MYDPPKRGHFTQRRTSSRTGLSCTRHKPSDCARVKMRAPRAGFQLHPLLSRDCASPSSAGGHVLQLLLREGASEHTGTVSNAGGGHMQTWPRKAKQDASAPKGSGQPIPLAFSSTEYDGLLDKPVDPSLPCDTAK